MVSVVLLFTLSFHLESLMHANTHIHTFNFALAIHRFNANTKCKIIIFSICNARTINWWRCIAAKWNTIEVMIIIEWKNDYWNSKYWIFFENNFHSGMHSFVRQTKNMSDVSKWVLFRNKFIESLLVFELQWRRYFGELL